VAEESPRKSVQLTPRQVELIKTIERPGDEWSIKPGSMVYKTVGDRGKITSKYTSYWYKIVHKLTDGPKTIDLATYSGTIGYYKCFNWYLKKKGIFRNFAIPQDPQTLATDDQRPKTTQTIEIPNLLPKNIQKNVSKYSNYLPESQLLTPHKIPPKNPPIIKSFQDLGSQPVNRNIFFGTNFLDPNFGSKSADPCMNPQNPACYR
jgi:hypothetical protein